MQQIGLESPELATVESREEDYLEELRKGKWIGEPEYSVELHLLDGTREAKAQSAMLLWDKISDLNLYTFFGDIPADISGKSRDYRRISTELSKEFGEDTVDREVYLNSLYGSLQESDLTPQEMLSAELTGMEDNLEVLEDIQRAMSESDEFVVKYVDLRASSEAGDIPAAYEDLQDSLALRLNFEYLGDRDATRRFQSLAVYEEEYEGIPGNITVDGSVETDIPAAEKVDLNDRKVERWVKDMVG